MSDVAQLTLAADMARWSDALSFIEDFCAGQGIAPDDMLRLTLVAEELFTNAVVHGHGGGAHGTIRLELAVAPGRLWLMQEDRAPPFDPIAHARARPPDLDAEVDGRTVGGLGLHLVLELAAEVRYAHEDGCNRIRIALAADSARGPADQGAVLPR